jgi:predicted Co/Zn/Cd cation transporter (cation efflux family)
MNFNLTEFLSIGYVTSIIISLTMIPELYDLQNYSIDEILTGFTNNIVNIAIAFTFSPVYLPLMMYLKYKKRNNRTEIENNNDI